ncbi:MAG TPA: cache domain-containing protein [Usitatibacter sp.]
MKQLFTLIVCFAIALLSIRADAADRATPAEAEALVKRAIAYYQTYGKQKAMDEFSKSPGPFIDRDLYVTVITMEGDSLAHINPKMRGHNMMDFRDVDGKYAIRERTQLARKQGSGWHEFKFFNPVTKAIETKRNYVETYDNLVFSAGAFRPQ